MKGNPENVSVPHEQGIHVNETIVINRPVEEIYNFWHHFEQLPQFMDHLESVEPLPNGHSHWVAKAPAGLKVDWEAEVVNDVPNQVIGWRSLENSTIPNAGSVRFKPMPGNRATEVNVEMEYVPPAGNLGKAVAALFGKEPGQQIRGDLERLKEILEGNKNINARKQ